MDDEDDAESVSDAPPAASDPLPQAPALPPRRGGPSLLANPQPIQIFYLTMPEDQVQTSFKVIYSGTGVTMTSVSGIAMTANGAIVYYDQWEDGYELDIANPTQASTLIWGDGNAVNGDACTVAEPASLCTGDVLSAGAVLILRNNVPLPRNPANLYYDGRDKIGVTKIAAVTRSLWATTPGTVLADAIEVYDTTRLGNDFRLPIGEDLSVSSNSMFEYVSLLIMGSQNGTTVYIDKDGNGSVDGTTTLNAGDAYQLSAAAVGDLTSNARITSTQPIQLNLLTGDIGSNYESRWFTIPPSTQWGGSYYAPVGTTSTNYPANVFVYNPNQSSAITVFFQTQTGAGSFVVPAKGVYRYAMPLLSGAHFYSTGAPFLAVAANDSTAGSGSNQTYDWGYTLIPEVFLTTKLAVGWAPGDGNLPPGSNGSPVWVIAVAPTTIYVDYDGNPATGALTDLNGDKYDVSYVLTAYESQRVFDPDKNQTGMRVYTLDGTLITAAWGEDAATARAGTPFLDVGYTILPLPQIVFDKTTAPSPDGNGNGQVDFGETIVFTITVRNWGLIDLVNSIISDTVPVNATYVAGSTTLGGAPLADDLAPPAATIFPLDEGGVSVPLLQVGQFLTITFKATANLTPPDYSYITNTAFLLTTAGDFTMTRTTPVNVVTTQCVVTYTNSGYTPVSLYLENETVYIQVNDADRNTNPGAVQTVTVLVQNTTTGDLETLFLTESGVNTGVFNGSIPAAATGGLVAGDGVLHAAAGETLQVNYSDPLRGDTCSDTAQVGARSQVKMLYLSTDGAGSPDQDLDRIDPVATGDVSTALSVLLGGGAAGVITPGAVTTGTTTAISVTVAHTTGASANRLMLVGVSFNTGSSASQVNSVSYAGNALTVVGTRNASGDVRMELWALTNPPSGAGNVVVTFNGAAGKGAVVGVATFSGVDQTTPYGSFYPASGDSMTPTVVVASAAGELVFDTVAYNKSDAITVGVTQTQRWNSAVSDIRGAASTEPGATSVTMSWSRSASEKWAIGAVSIKPAQSSGITTTSFTQTPTMASAFTMPVGGLITITTYISGALGTNGTKSVTGTLSYGGIPFATLTAPTWNSGAGTLIWTGAMTGNVTVPAGQAISLTVTSGITNPFQIRYDSSTYPSKIELPTSSVIKVDALAIYDAPYAGGVALTGGYPGQTVYVRTTVSDPFGAYDIVTLTLNLSGTLVTLNNTYVVATPTAASKIYQYAWTLPSSQGLYNVIATAHEGYEGITATKSLPFDVRFLDTGTPCQLLFTGGGGAATSGYSPNGTIYLKCTDLDEDTLAVAQTITVTLTSSSGDSEVVTLTETGISTGVFTGSIASSTTLGGGANSGTLNAPIGASLAASYTDDDDPTDVCNAAAFINNTVPDVSLSKTLIEPVDGQAVVSETVRFDLVVGNPGPTTLVTVRITDTFDSSRLTFQSASITPTSVATPTLVWNDVGPILTGTNKTISVWFHAAAPGDAVTNTARTRAVDSNSVVVTEGPVTATVDISQPGITLTKTLINPPSGTAVVTGTATFRVYITNTGTTTITNLPLSDSYSSYCLAFQSSSPAASGAGGGAALWSNLGPLGVGLSTSVVVTFHVEGPCTPAVNTAVVNAATDVNGDPLPAVQGSASVTTTALPPQMALVKTLISPASGTAVVSDTITYTIRMTNTGPNAITSLTLTDTYSNTCLTLTAASITPTTTSAGLILWDTLIPPEPPLLSGQSMTVTLAFHADAEAVCLNTAVMAGADEFGQAVGPLTSTAPVTIVQNADLLVTKRDNPDPVIAGQTLTYTVVVTNAGPSNATGVLVTDTLPAGVAYASNSASQGSYASGTGVWSVGSLSVNASATLTLVMTVNAGTTGVITNTVTTSSAQPDPNTANNTDEEPTTVNTSADLSVVKTDNPDPVMAGQTLTYTIVVSNAGPSNATGVLMTDTLPGGVTYSSSSVSQGSYASGTGIWAVGALNVNASATLTLVVTVNAGTTGVITNTVATSGNQPDPNTANNTDDEPTTVSTSADLLVVKKDNPDPVIAGQTLTYTIVVSNAGPSNATGVLVSDTLPAGVTYSGNSTSQGSYASGTGVWTVGSLAVNASATLTLVVTVNAGTTGVITNTVNVSGAQPDPNTANNTDEEPTTVSTSADLLVTKRDNPDPVIAGQTLTYTVVVTNAGPSNATGVLVTDTLPAGVTYASNSASQGSYASGTGVWTVGALNVNASATLTLVVTVNAGTTGVITNTVTTSGNQTDPNTANNTDDEPTSVMTSADLGIAKSDTSDPVIAGQTLTYTVVVTNAGPSSATGVLVTDTLPVSVTYVGHVVSQGAYVSGTGVWSVGSLAVNASATLTLVVTVNAGTRGVITNTVEVSAIEPDANPSNNRDDEPTFSVVNDLQISKSDGGAISMPGNAVVYTLTYTNAGNITATNVVITEVVPAGATYSATASLPTLWSCNGTGTGSVCTLLIAELAAGVTGTLRFGLTVDDPLGAGIGYIDNYAWIGDDGTHGPDADRASNAASDQTPIVSLPDMQLTKRTGNVVTAGGLITYVLYYTNTGNVAATNVVITETVPDHTTFAAAPSLPTVWSCADGAPAGAVCTVNVGTVAGKGGAGSVLFAVRVENPLAAGTVITNTARVGNDGAQGQDPTPANNASTTTQAATTSTLFSKVDWHDPVTPGWASQRYNIVIQNTGPTTITNLVVTDTLPSGTQYLEATTVLTGTTPPDPGPYWWASGGAFDGFNRVVWVVGDLPPGYYATMRLRVRVYSNVPPGSVLVNTAVLSASSGATVTTTETTNVINFPPTATPTPVVTVSPTPVGQTCELAPYLLLNAGGSQGYTDLLGNVWLADQAYITGTTTWGYLGYSSAYTTSANIANAVNPTLYRAQRWWPGNGQYRIDLPNGIYQVRLHFAEIYPWAGVSSRVFTATVEGQTLVGSLDLAQTVGVNRAYDVQTNVVIVDGALNIGLLARRGSPAINAISVYQIGSCGTPTQTPTAASTSTPTQTPTATPTAVGGAGGPAWTVNAGGGAYSDGGGRLWQADQAYSAGGWGYVGGNTASSNAGISNTNDDPLYQGNRWWESATGSYKFSVPNGVYTVTLHFAETYQWATRGSRVFDVRIEGAVVRSNVDIVALAGHFRPHVLDFPGIQVSDGVLQVDFVKRTGPPMVSGIAVTP